VVVPTRKTVAVRLKAPIAPNAGSANCAASSSQLNYPTKKNLNPVGLVRSQQEALTALLLGSKYLSMTQNATVLGCARGRARAGVNNQGLFRMRPQRVKEFLVSQGIPQ